MKHILAVDVGTTAMKVGVFSTDLACLGTATRGYEARLYDAGKADIEPEKWWEALVACCHDLGAALESVRVLSLSVTTPGLTAMAEDGTALGPAILFFDGRSNEQAHQIRERVGEDKFLRETCNLPVSGGSSLASILWIREHQPGVWERTAKFGHTNTYLVKRLTGRWAIDPSTTSITGLYNTARNDMTWNSEVLAAAELDEELLPPLLASHTCAGELLPGPAAALGLAPGIPVLCGGNDAVLACLSGGLTEPGGINNINGTCEITTVCVDRPISSPNFNLRCHVIPGRWRTFFVLNTGGKALEWFHANFCSEMAPEEFYQGYLPNVIDDFFNHPDLEQREAGLPTFVPYLQGSRYTLDRLTASFSNVTLETTRKDFLMAILRGNACYHGDHLRELAGLVPLGRQVMMTGGGAQIRGIERIKKRWTGDFDWGLQEQSSLLGAAMLGQVHLS